MRKTILAAFLLGVTVTGASAMPMSAAKSFTKICPMISKFDLFNRTKQFNNVKIFKSTKKVQVSKFRYMARKQYAKTGIFYNIRGYPIFEKVAVCDLKLPTGIAKVQNRNLHARYATRMLRKGIKSGKIDSSKFNNVQISAINLGQAKIPGYTWHHHQNFRRMQLVPEEYHATPHDGGFSLWYKK
ncbi:MAG: HNH endonuclease [Alphaproteobacteria bacterium]|nr:HNH endonuclease [Alphaproteobacteria bacterium]